MSITYRRMGRFFLSDELVVHDPETALAIMGKVIVAHCKREKNVFMYIALSPEFDEMPQGETVAPEYNVHIRDGGKRIEFKRVNQTNLITKQEPTP